MNVQACLAVMPNLGKIAVSKNLGPPVIGGVENNATPEPDLSTDEVLARLYALTQDKSHPNELVEVGESWVYWLM